MKIPMTVEHILSTINGKVKAQGVYDGILQLRDLLNDPRMQTQLDDISRAIGADDGIYVRGSDVVSEHHGVQCGLAHLRICFGNVGDAGSLVGPMKEAIATIEKQEETKEAEEPKKQQEKETRKTGPIATVLIRPESTSKRRTCRR